MRGREGRKQGERRRAFGKVIRECGIWSETSPPIATRGGRWMQGEGAPHGWVIGRGLPHSRQLLALLERHSLVGAQARIGAPLGRNLMSANRDLVWTRCVCASRRCGRCRRSRSRGPRRTDKPRGAGGRAAVLWCVASGSGGPCARLRGDQHGHARGRHRGVERVRRLCWVLMWRTRTSSSTYNPPRHRCRCLHSIWRSGAGVGGARK